MVHTVVDGTYRQTNLTTESPEYLARREELRLAEIELMGQRERVAEMRRHLPQGAALQDYEFQEGPRDLDASDASVRAVRLSELFTKRNRALVIYHFMFGKKQSKACPMCTAWIDGANGVAHHLAQNLDFAVVAAADVPTLRAYARSRGWDKLRLLSAGNRTFSTISAAKTVKGIRTPLFPSSLVCQRHSAALLHRASTNGSGHPGAWHRLARSHVAFHGSHAPRPRQLVCQPRLRHPSRRDRIVRADF